MPPRKNPNSAPKPTSIRQIAKVAKLHPATVARALRNDPRITNETRTRVETLAQKMGYHPDPELAAMMSRIKASRPQSYQESFAFVAMNAAILKTYGMKRLFQGACDQANRFGYNVEVFFLDDFQSNLRRLSSILSARGIRGVMFQPLFDSTSLQEFAWGKFASVSLGAPLPQFSIHCARPSHYQMMILAMDKIIQAGYERVGFFITEDASYWTNHEWESAFVFKQLHFPVVQRIPILKLQETVVDVEPRLTKILKAWIEKNHLDAVISMCGLHRHLRSMGKKVPLDVAYVELYYQDHLGDVSGIEQQVENTGAAGVDLLIGQIHRRERGLPEHPKTVLTDSIWLPGSTLGQKKKLRQGPG
jgi:LacI family transcriptional regulator